MIITIDGPASSGKSTVAEILAKELGFIHFNSGALFRGITAHLYKHNFDIESISSNSTIPTCNLEVVMINNEQHVFVNSIDYTAVLRDNEISTLVAYVAQNKTCREIIDNCQRTFGEKNNIVIEGRDVGSHVFPNAQIKFYLDCSVQERARRRFLEEKTKNSLITIDEIEQQIKKRDDMDKNRDIAPLIVPTDAIIIDSTTLTIDEVVEKMLSYVTKEIDYPLN
ncbi:MAG: (d)CMP kinase [Clostridia bacterium]|nr:(d)CMP kinase [Clostridia bacterium]